MFGDIYVALFGDIIQHKYNSKLHINSRQKKFNSYRQKYAGEQSGLRVPSAILQKTTSFREDDQFC